jgi:hypothetical protein
MSFPCLVGGAGKGAYIGQSVQEELALSAELCARCFCQPETNDHMFTECNFTEVVRYKMAQYFVKQQTNSV